MQPPRAEIARSSNLGHWTHWAVLYRPEALRAAGGLHGGYRAGWDTLVTQLLAFTHPITVVDEPMYHYVQRDTSLTRSRDTGMRSAYRQRSRAVFQRILTSAHQHPDRIARLTAMQPYVQASVNADAERLRTMLKARGLE